MEFEGYGTGGIVEIVYKDRVDFMRDIAPYFYGTFAMIFFHSLYYFTGNLAIPFFIGLSKQLFTRFMGLEKLKDRQNLS